MGIFEGNERRKNNDIFIASAQKLDDFMNKAEERWKVQDQDIKELKEFMARVDTPVKAVLWAFGLISAAFLAALGTGLYSWLKKHFIF